MKLKALTYNVGAGYKKKSIRKQQKSSNTLKLVIFLRHVYDFTAFISFRGFVSLRKL